MNLLQLHLGKVDSLSPDWDKESADLTLRKDSKGEAFVSALWHLLPLQTRIQTFELLCKLYSDFCELNITIMLKKR